MNSDGTDYTCKLDAGQPAWTEVDRDHSVVLNATKLELCDAPGVYFH